jgi:hypothetical protein
MNRRLLDKVGTVFLALVIACIILMVGLNIGRYLERSDVEARVETATALCNRYVVALGEEVDKAKQENIALIKAFSMDGPVEVAKGGDDERK